MVDATRSSVSGRGLAALGRVARTPPMLAASKAAWTREADGLTGRPPGRQDRPGAAQTRQITPRAREIVASPIYNVFDIPTDRSKYPSDRYRDRATSLPPQT